MLRKYSPGTGTAWNNTSTVGIIRTVCRKMYLASFVCCKVVGIIGSHHSYFHLEKQNWPSINGILFFSSLVPLHLVTRRLVVFIRFRIALVTRYKTRQNTMSSCGRKRGRRSGESYNRRTDAQIAIVTEALKRKKREEEETDAAKKARFFEPTTAAPPAANTAPQFHPELNNITPPKPTTPQPPQPHPADDVPYNLDVVPPLFRKFVREAAEEIRIWSKNQSHAWNQHSKRDFNSQGFPWKSFSRKNGRLRICCSAEYLSSASFFLSLPGSKPRFQNAPSWPHYRTSPS
jgi:hypothetical protein